MKSENTEAAGKASLDTVVVRGITPRLRRAFNHALGLANQSGHKYVGAEHMLLGLLMEPGSAAHCLLRQQGLDTDQLLRNLQATWEMELARARAHNADLSHADTTHKQKETSNGK
jgi:ATP-dependent Clp protease ATP-binding subunit ClpA